MRAELAALEDLATPFAVAPLSPEDTRALAGTHAGAAPTNAMQESQLDNEGVQTWQDLLWPVMHYLYLITLHSPFYNTQHRVGLFVRLLENVTIRRARDHVLCGRGNEVFVDESTTTAARLEDAIQGCFSLKNLYFQYEIRSQDACAAKGQSREESAWARPQSGIFSRLDLFIERCQDVLFLTKSASTFEILRCIEIGGANGHKSTARARSLHEDILSCIKMLTGVDYSLLVVDKQNTFEQDFGRMCASLKALQMRGLSIVQLAYDDCYNLESLSDLILSLGRVLLLDAFRPLLMKMLGHAIVLHQTQVQATRSILLREQASRTRKSANNLATVTGKIYWVKALQDRLWSADARLGSLQALMQSNGAEGYQEAYADAANLRNALSNYESVVFAAWVKQVEQLPEQLLNQPILIRCESHFYAVQSTAQNSEQRVIEINFEQSVLEHLREAKYLKQLGFMLPAAALYLFERSEKIRGYLAHMKLIVNQHNNLYAMAAEPEWPLVSRTLQAVEEHVEAAASSISWKSNRIDDFIVKMDCELQVISRTLDKLKENRLQVTHVLEDWGRSPLFRRKKTQSYSLSAFEHLHATHVQARYKIFEEGALRIHNLVEHSMALCSADWTQTYWIEYVRYVRQVCADWIKSYVQDNLRRVREAVTCHEREEVSSSMASDQDEMSGDMALLEITLELLHGNSVAFVPPIRASDSQVESVQSSVYGWRESVISAVAHATHDALTVDYSAQIDTDEEIASLRDEIDQHVEYTAEICEAFKQSFEDYRFLWLEAGEHHFQTFLQRVLLPNGQDLPDMVEVASSVDLLLQLRARLATYADFRRIDWVRIDARPLKSAISTLLSSRLDRHMVFLQDYVGTNLDKIYDFLVATTLELTKANEIRTGNEYLLPLALRSTVRSIKENREKLEGVMDCLENVAAFLRRHGCPITKTRQSQLKNMFQLWTDLQKFALQVKDRYSSHVATEVDRLRKRVSNLQIEYQTVKNKLAHSLIWHPAEDSESSYQLIAEVYVECCRLVRDQTEIYDMENLLEVSIPFPDSMPLINECLLQLYAAKRLWDAHDLVEHYLRRWNLIKWSDVQVSALLSTSTELKLLLTQVAECQHTHVQNMLETYVRSSLLYTKIEDDLNFILASLPLAARLQHPAVRQRHLKKLMSISGEAFALDDKVTFSEILKMRLPSYADDIHTLVTSAEKELRVEEGLSVLQQRWAGEKLIVSKHADVERGVLSPEMETVVSNLLEIEVQRNLMMSSRYGEVFRESGLMLQREIAQAVEFIELMTSAQAIWLTLIGLVHYDATGLLEMLPELKPSFEAADSKFRAILEKTISHNAIQDMMPLIHTARNEVNNLQHDLEKCEKLVLSWLDQRRAAYPRLYLLSDEELMRVLSEGMQSPRKLTIYLPRIFQGMHALAFATSVHSTGTEVIAVRNKQGETLALGRELKFKPRETIMEDWLKEIGMRVSAALKSAVLDGVRKMATHRLAHWAVTECLQVVLLSFKVQWTGMVERALDNAEYEDSMRLLDDLKLSSQDNVDKVAQYLRDMSLHYLKRFKYSMILASEIWSVDAIRFLIVERQKKGSTQHTLSPNMFEWQMQMRFYLRHVDSDEDSSCRIRVGACSLDYGFELIEFKEAFCFSSTSLKSMMGFTMVMQHRMIVALGSSSRSTPCAGKTETFKQMAMSAGKYMHIFNATPFVSAKRIIADLLGLTQSGAWGLFENFDKMPARLMCYSACLIKSVLSAVRGGQMADFEGTQITPTSECGLFISLGGHMDSGRDLPHELRSLMRPVSVFPPDFTALAQMLLMARGFNDSVDLAKKVCSHLQMCSNMLATAESNHLWWSAATLHCLIRAAGEHKMVATDAEEDRIIVDQILRLMGSRTSPDQQALLTLITHRIFGFSTLSFQAPSSVGQRPLSTAADAVNLDQHSRQVVEAKGLQATTRFLNGLDQLRQILAVRSSVFVVGEPGVGKTQTWRMLAAIGNQSPYLERDGKVIVERPGHKKVVVKTMNPNAVELRHFCGSYDKGSQEWQPGAFSNLLRNARHVSSQRCTTWIVLDGEVQAEWLELLSSSFDSLQRLPLDSGEVLQVDHEIRIVMETSSLKDALPSSAARSGVLFVNDQAVSIEDCVASWTENLQRDSVKSEMQGLFAAKLPLLLEFIGKNTALETFAPVSARSCCRSMLCILDGLIMAEGDKWDPASRAVKCSWMFDFASIWGFGGSLAVDKVLDCRRIFSDWWRHSLGTLGGYQLPLEGTVFDYTFHHATFEICMWKELLSPTKYFQQSSRDDVVVSTPSSVCISKILDLVTVHANHRALLIGQPGIGKTCMVREYLKGLPVNFIHSRLALNYRTSIHQVQMHVNQHLQKQAGQVFAPPHDKTLLLFVDDMSSPCPNAKHVCATSQLLLQYIEHNMCYGLETMRGGEIKNVQYVATATPNKGRASMDGRLLNKFCVITIVEPTRLDVASVFSSVISSFSTSLEPQVKSVSETLGVLMAHVHTRLAEHFSKSQYPAHYAFSLHNLRSVLDSMCYANAELYATPVLYISLWVHELHREYCDRLERPTDVHVLKAILREGMHKHLDSDLAENPLVFDMAHVADFESGIVSPSSVSTKVRGASHPFPSASCPVPL